MNKGFIPVILLVIGAVVVASGIGYFAMRGSLNFKAEPSPTLYTYDQLMKMTPEPVSGDKDFGTIEAELDATVVGSPDGDLINLESSASAL